jgi:hypothetical protein
MTAPTSRAATDELTILGFMAGVALFAGIALIIAGIVNGNGGYFDGPSLGDVALKVTLISIGSTVVSAGFLSLLAAILLSGVRRVVAANPRALATPARATPPGAPHQDAEER